MYSETPVTIKIHKEENVREELSGRLINEIFLTVLLITFLKNCYG